jgi:hypothetical protein
LELKRSGPDNLPSYNDALVRRCLQELQLASQQLEQLVTAATLNASSSTTSSSRPAPAKKPDMSVRPALFLLDAMMQRQKQSLLAYHVVRWNRWKQQYYYNNNDESSNTYNLMNPQVVLSEAEHDIWKDYDALVTEYTQQWGFRPSSHRAGNPASCCSTMCQVRVVASTTTTVVLSSSGQVLQLIPGAVLYLARDDVQDLQSSSQQQSNLLEYVAGEDDLE